MISGARYHRVATYNVRKQSSLSDWEEDIPRAIPIDKKINHKIEEKIFYLS